MEFLNLPAARENQKLKEQNEQLQKRINELETKNIKYHKIIFYGRLQGWVFETLYNKGEITVISLTGGRTKIEVAHYTTILDVKTAIFNKIGIPTHQCRLIFGGKQLCNHRTLFHYLIPVGATIHMVTILQANANSPASMPSAYEESCSLTESQNLEVNTDRWFGDRYVTSLLRKREYEQRYGLVRSSYTIQEPSPLHSAIPQEAPPPAPAPAASMDIFGGC